MKRRQFLSSCAVGLTVCGAAAAQAESKNVGDLISGKSLADAAYQHFIPGKLTCCESILKAGCEALDMESELVPDIALGLAGGVGLQGDTCGIVTSSAMVLSLAVAAKEKDYAAKKMKTLEAVGQFYVAFKERVHDTKCRALCDLDLTTIEGRTKLKEHVKANRCADLVRVGALLLADELNKV